MKTYSEARARLRWYQGRYIDFDGWYGYQCADLAVDYIYWLLEIRMWGMQKMQSITILKTWQQYMKTHHRLFHK